MHSPNIGGSRRQPLPETPSVKPAKPHPTKLPPPPLFPESAFHEPTHPELTHHEETIQAQPQEEPIQVSEAPLQPVLATGSVLLSLPDPPDYYEREAVLRKQWSENGKHCPICNRHLTHGITGHLSKCLRMQLSNSGSQATT